MEHEFWHAKWKSKQLGFHEGRPNALLVKHFSRLELRQGARLFLPLCGKTRDIGWLLEQGYRVVGSELSESAVQELFEELGVAPAVTEVGTLKLYAAENVEILVGDIFHVSPEILGPVDAIYDRAALVALPPTVRANYTAHLRTITGTAPQLLIVFAYDQNVMPGPPFSIPAQEVEEHYATFYELEPLESKAVEGKLKGQVEAIETIRILRPH